MVNVKQVVLLYLSQMRILVDMDEVLAKAHDAWQVIYEERTGNILGDKVNGNDMRDIIPVKHKQLAMDILNEEGFFANLEVMEDAVEVMEKLLNKHEIYVVSAAMQFPNSLRDKSNWLDNHFPFIHWRYRMMTGSKAPIAADVLIDDHVHNLKNFTGPRPLIFTSHHNTKVEKFERVNTWREIEEKLL